MPILALIFAIPALFILYKLFARSEKGSSPARWILGGGMIVSALLASRIFGARVLYFAIPMIQQWMAGGGEAQAKQQRKNSQAPASPSNMSRAEAALILGIPAKASEAEVNQAYKALMLKLHPDQGGNDYLASKLNLAREVMLS